MYVSGSRARYVLAALGEFVKSDERRTEEERARDNERQCLYIYVRIGLL